MAALLKYFMGIAVILPAVVLVSAMTIGEIFVGFAAIARAPSTETPRWNIERLKAAQDLPDIALRSLSPIYPVTPGKELLGRPVYTASAKRINTPPGVTTAQIASANIFGKRRRQKLSAAKLKLHADVAIAVVAAAHAHHFWARNLLSQDI